MADISKITTPDGTSYDVKDSTARSSITTLSGKVLPDVTSSDNGKVLEVTSGAWGVGTEKANVANPVFTGSLSNGRKANTTVGTSSFAFGTYAEASGAYSYAQGISLAAKGVASHAEGEGTNATNEASHAEGISTTASGVCAHVEGQRSTASGFASHAEGTSTTSSGAYSHAEGLNTTASGAYSHSEGTSATASGEASHAEGVATIANHVAQHAGGKFNVADPSTNAANQLGNYAEIIGNGTADNARSNARALDWSGNEYLMGDLYVGCNADSTGGTKIVGLPAVTASDDGKFLTVVSGAWTATTMSTWQGGSY